LTIQGVREFASCKLGKKPRRYRSLLIRRTREREEIEEDLYMCMDRAAVPVKRAWLGIAARFGLLRRKTGKLSAFLSLSSLSLSLLDLSQSSPAGVCRRRRLIFPSFFDLLPILPRVTTNGRFDAYCAGLKKLRKEVQTCEYRDVHLMWQMLRAPDSPAPLEEKEAAAAAAVAAAAGARKRKNAWRRFIYYCCAF
jgi:hypothetical protein